MRKQKSQEKVASGKVMTLLGIIGILGLVMLAFGVYAIFEISLALGIALFVLGVLTYIAFVLIEKRLKLL